jgi:[ribosomal protein S5]-alanine N-acetyltransferase
LVERRSTRLLLREFVEADWPALHEVESRPEVARYQAFEPRTEAESRAYVLGAVADQAAEPRTTYDMAVVLIANDRLIGRCGLGLIDVELGEASLWYTLHPDFWGQGYTTEAARSLVGFGFRQLELHRVWADCDPENPGSWRVLEKLGMRREGHLLQNVKVDDGWADSYLYAILDQEWRANNPDSSAG